MGTVKLYIFQNEVKPITGQSQKEQDELVLYANKTSNNRIVCLA